MQAIPADDAVLRVSHGERANLEPAVHAIDPTDTVLRVISSRMPGFNGTRKGGDHAREVIWMNEVVGSPTF